MGIRRRRGSCGRLSVAISILALCTPLLVGLGASTATANGLDDGSSGGVAAIGLDSTSPPGHNWGFNDFFPREGVRIHSGDVIDFGWRANADGLHNVAVLKSGLTPEQAWATYPVAVPDPGDPPPGLQFNPLTNLGNHAPAGSGLPGACGDAATPCPYDGSDNVVDAANPTDGQHHFRVAVNAPAGSVVDFVCLIHAGMQGSVKVVGDDQPATSPNRINRLASRQLRADTAGGFAAEREANDKLVQHNPDGTRLVTLRAGANAGKVELFEMLPSNVRLHPGDQVQWRYTAGDEIHTVTFPEGTTQGEPLVPACEGSPDTDFVPPSSGAAPCGDPSKFELHLFPQPFGTTTISTPTTFGSSGIISAPGGPLPSITAPFTFPNAGTFTYYCHIHDHMTGTLNVAPGHQGGGHGDDDSEA